MCASSSCSGIQCSCSAFAQCMEAAGPNCESALLDYYDCSNTGCSSTCGG
jgi:hypothetical protein